MAEDPQPEKILLIFFRTMAGSEPVREWLNELPEKERQAIGKECCERNAVAGRNAAVPCDGSGLWEIRTDLPPSDYPVASASPNR